MIVLLSRLSELLHESEAIASARRLVTQEPRLAPRSSPVLPPIPPRRSLRPGAHESQHCSGAPPPGRRWSPGAGERQAQQSPCSLCLPLSRCHLGQASQSLDDAQPLLHLV